MAIASDRKVKSAENKELMRLSFALLHKNNI